MMTLFPATPVSASAAYAVWFRKVDAVIQSRVGLCAMDLPDYCYVDAFADGVSPAQCAAAVIKAAKEDF